MPSAESLAVRAVLEQQKEAAKHGPALSIPEQRQNFESMSTLTPVDASVQIERTEIAGLAAEQLTPPDPVHGTFLYWHGGAYYMGSAATHRELGGRLARATMTQVWIPEYRLAPEHPYPAALNDAVSVYRALLEQGIPAEQIMMGGDSAGGGLTAATLVTLRDQGLPMPRGAILLSPWTDLAGTGDSMQTRAPFDPWLEPEGIRAGAQFYVNGDNPKNPLISPVYANLEGFPPLLVFVGHDECLLDDSARLVQHAQDAGVSVTFKVWEGMWHVFVAFAAQVPEAREAIAEIGVWARSLLS